MIGILIVSHEPLGTALLHCTRHVYGRLPLQVPLVYWALRVAKVDVRAAVRERIG